MTEVGLRLPEDVARQLQTGGRDLARRALEALAVDGHRAGEITAAQVQRMLSLSSRWEADAVLKRHEAYLPYTEADLDADLLAIRRAGAR